MKFIKDYFDKNRKFFEKGGKFEKLKPLFEAGDTFTFTPDTVTKSGAHVRDSVDLKRMMMTVIYAVVPCFIFGTWNAGHQYNIATAGAPHGFIADCIRGLIIVIPIVFVSYAAGGFWEVYFSCVRKHEVNEGLLVTGLLFPLILPPTIPLWQVAVGISFGVVIGKEVFGGTGMNIVNPALMSRAFLFFGYAKWIVGDVWVATAKGGELVDGITTATPLGLIATLPAASSETAAAAIPDAPQQLVSAMETLAHHNYTFSRMFWGVMPGSIGETSAAMCLVGAIVLLATGVASWRIMVSGVAGVLLTGFLFTLNGHSAISHIPPHYHLVMGGLAFGLVFMATDPVSSCATNAGKYIYGFMTGMLIIIVRAANPVFPEGVMLSILFMNISAPLIDYYVVAAHIRRRKRKLA